MTVYLVRRTGNDNNGGTSATVRSTGTDGVTNGTNTLTSVTGTWGAGDIGHSVFIGGVNQWRLVTAVASATSLTFSGATVASGSGRTWTVGGAWLTLGKALGSAGIVSGDTVYVGAGIYRETVTVAMTSATVETSIIADVDGAQTGDAGEVVWTAYTTNDTTAPAAAPCLNLAGRDFLTFQKLVFIGGNADPACVNGNTASSINCSYRECLFIGAVGGVVGLTATVDVALNTTFDRCVFLPISGNHVIALSAPTSTVADYDLNVLIQNCKFHGSHSSNMLQFTPSGANAFKPGGVSFYDCSCLGGNILASVVANGSAVFPVKVYGCLLQFMSTGVSASGAGSVIEDYNRIECVSTRSNVAIGPNTVAGTTYAPLFHAGQEAFQGKLPRPFLAPLAGSPLLGFGNVSAYTHAPSTAADDATVGTIAWTNPNNALLPEGTNLAVATNIPATTGISHYLKITGGLAVPGGATIVSVRVEVIYKASAGSALAFSSVKLVKAGVISGNDHATDVAAQWTTALQVASLGTAADPLWGLTLSQSDVNAADFGVVLSIKNTSAGAQTASIDYVRMIVAYTPAPVSVDLLNRPRPAGGSSLAYAVGALERHDTGVKETSVTDVGATSLRLDGPADQDFRIPVDAVSTVITVRARYDGNHGSATKPRAILLDNGEIGVATETKTMTAAQDTWETLTFTSIVPTAKGWVTLRLVSRPTAANGIAYFDTVTVT